MGKYKRPVRKLLRDRIQKLFRTQDYFAYEAKLDAGILSRIINCTKDPTEEQVITLCNYLKMSRREVLKKDG